MKKHTCPIAKTAEIIKDTWTILIVRDVLKSPSRFCELEKSLSGISTRTLTKKLQDLEKYDIIKKDNLFYAPTPKGKELGKIIKAMEKFGEEN
jgi:DNA-binding HxlR family transcriptional regulator